MAAAKLGEAAQIQEENVKLDETLDYIAGLDAQNIKDACEGALTFNMCNGVVDAACGCAVVACSEGAPALL